MANRKSYNSILFLTVYLGLVLVGGSSQVLAHAATNSLFDLRTEIEYKDDLDKKPDDSKAKVDEQNNQFVEDYIKLVSSSLSRYQSNREYAGAFEDKDFSFLRKDFPINFSQLKANKDKFFSKLSFKTNFESKKLTSFVLAFDQNLRFKIHKAQNFSEKIIFENTKVSSANNQIFIVTRLPRGSIDPLLKQ